MLIYGADVRGVAAVRELFQNSAAGLKPIGFIDDDPRERGKLVSGLPVFGTERELEGIIRMREGTGAARRRGDDLAGTSGAGCPDLQTGRRENVPTERQRGAIR